MKTRAGIVALVLAASFALAACGESGSGIDRDASEILQAQVKSARAAVAAGDPARAGQLLQAVDDTVASLRNDHLISDRKAADVLAALGATQDALHSWVASSTTTSTTTTTVAPPPPPPAADDHGGKGRDNGGKGKGGDDD